MCARCSCSHSFCERPIKSIWSPGKSHAMNSNFVFGLIWRWRNRMAIYFVMMIDQSNQVIVFCYFVGRCCRRRARHFCAAYVYVDALYRSAGSLWPTVIYHWAAIKWVSQKADNCSALSAARRTSHRNYGQRDHIWLNEFAFFDHSWSPNITRIIRSFIVKAFIIAAISDATREKREQVF